MPVTLNKGMFCKHVIHFDVKRPSEYQFEELLLIENKIYFISSKYIDNCILK